LFDESRFCDTSNANKPAQKGQARCRGLMQRGGEQPHNDCALLMTHHPGGSVISIFFSNCFPYISFEDVYGFKSQPTFSGFSFQPFF
jgi:hypothetical protein